MVQLLRQRRRLRRRVRVGHSFHAGRGATAAAHGALEGEGDVRAGGGRVADDGGRGPHAPAARAAAAKEPAHRRDRARQGADDEVTHQQVDLVIYEPPLRRHRLHAPVVDEDAVGDGRRARPVARAGRPEACEQAGVERAPVDLHGRVEGEILRLGGRPLARPQHAEVGGLEQGVEVGQEGVLPAVQGGGRERGLVQAAGQGPPPARRGKGREVADQAAANRREFQGGRRVQQAGDPVEQGGVVARAERGYRRKGEGEGVREGGRGQGQCGGRERGGGPQDIWPLPPLFASALRSDGVTGLDPFF